MRNTRLITALMAIFCVTLAASASEQYEWKARWITKEQCLNESNTWMAFRKTVDLKTIPSSVTARIAADSKYWLWINGQTVVLDGGLKRGPAPGDSYYDKVEIAPFLTAGENRIDVLVQYFGKTGFSHMSSGQLGLLFEAVGDGVEILSDGSWQAGVQNGYRSMASVKPNYRLPESDISYDARLFPFDWFEKPGRLGSAMVLGFAPGKAPFGRLVERTIPLWKDYGVREYQSVTQSGDTLVCKLPYNCHVSPMLKVEAPAGKVIRMETDHAVVTGSECLRTEYITKEGVQEYEYFGWISGEYMYYIVPEGVKVLGVKYRETGYDTEFSGYFHCDDDLLNDYWERAVRTLYVCMRDTYYDCPDRERAQWWGDEVDELAEAFYALSPSSSKLALKGMYELVNWQRADDVMFSPIPATNWSRELPIQILAAVGWYGFHHYWEFSGDDSFVADLYDGVHRYLHNVWKLDGNGMPIYRNGDWDWPDAGDNCDKLALVAPWYWLALKSECDFAKMLCRADDVREDEAIMANISSKYNGLFWNGTEYRSPSYEGLTDDRVHAMAVITGFAGEDKYPAIAAVLATQMHATTFMHRFVLEALYKMKRPDIALDRMHKLYPTIMKDGCSTLYEHWNFDGSCNHAWAGNGIVAMGKDIAGIKPVEPGFKVFELSPQMGALKEVDAAVDTSFGKIEVSLRRKGRRIDVILGVPEGTEAKVPMRKGNVASYGPGKHIFTISQ